MQQPAAVGQVGAWHVGIVAKDRRADHQHQVVAGQLFRQRTDGKFEVARELRVVLGKAAALTARWPEYGDAQLLRKRDRFRPGMRPVYIRSDHERGVCGLFETARKHKEPLRVRCDTVRHRAYRGRPGRFRFPVVKRQRKIDGALRRLHGDGVRAHQGRGSLLRM